MVETQTLYTKAGGRKYLSVSERERFVCEAAKEDLETFALCLVLCLTGCRISEALALKRQHVDQEERSLRFRTLKRRKARVEWRSIPVPEQLLQLLALLPTRNEGRLFPIVRSTAWRRIVKIMHRAGIEGPQATPRGLRHYFGVYADAQSIPQPVLQRWMGHAKLESTAIYRQAVGEEERILAARMNWINYNVQ